jgi:chorismate-pyruvate lyase
MMTTICNDDMGALVDLFIADHDRPDHLDAVAVENLEAFARVLLVTDGTVTHMLRAHFREPINVEVLNHDFQNLEHTNPWLEAKVGDDILKRKVALIGASTGHVYCHATSWIALERLSNGMREDIIKMRRSIGNVLLANFSENRRELLWCGQTKQDQFLERAYRVISGGVPLMIIAETFGPAISRQ